MPRVATSASGRARYVEPTTTRHAASTAARARRSASSRPARSTSTSPAARPATASRRRRSSSPPTRSASTSPTSRTIQGDTAVTPFGAGTGGSRSGSMIAGAIARDRRRSSASGSWRSPPTVLEASPDDIVLADGRASVARVRRSIGLTMAEIADLAYFQATSCRRRSPPGLEASARYRAEPDIWANATHVCTCEVDIVHRPGRAAPLHRQRGLRPDDQPERRRGPDRRRHRAGHRRRAARAPRLRRGRQPARHHVHRLPPAHRHRGADDRVRPHRDVPGPGPGGYKGVGEGGAIGAPPAVVNAVADALAPLGVDDHPAAAQPGGDRRRWSTMRRRAARRPTPMKPAPFDYHAPDDDRRGRRPARRARRRAKVLAGGQSLIPHARAAAGGVRAPRRPPPRRGAARHRAQRRRRVWIGAGTTQATIERSAEVAERVPLLARATPLIGHFQIRNRGTIGGSLAHADAAAEYPAVALALDAELEAAVADGAAARSRPPSSSPASGRTALGDDELLTGVTVPDLDRAGAGSPSRSSPDATATSPSPVPPWPSKLDDDRARFGAARIGLLGLGSTPVRATAPRQRSLGVPVDDVRRRRGRTLAPSADLDRRARGPARFVRLPPARGRHRAWPRPGRAPSRRRCDG